MNELRMEQVTGIEQYLSDKAKKTMSPALRNEREGEFTEAVSSLATKGDIAARHLAALAEQYNKFVDAVPEGAIVQGAVLGTQLFTGKIIGLDGTVYDYGPDPRWIIFVCVLINKQLLSRPDCFATITRLGLPVPGEISRTLPGEDFVPVNVTKGPSLLEQLSASAQQE